MWALSFAENFSGFHYEQLNIMGHETTLVCIFKKVALNSDAPRKDQAHLLVFRLFGASASSSPSFSSDLRKGSCVGAVSK